MQIYFQVNQNEIFITCSIRLQNIDYLIWTGDLVQHDVWNQTNDSIMDIIEDTIRLVSEKLPGVQVFPALGNHERAPANWY